MSVNTSKSARKLCSIIAAAAVVACALTWIVAHAEQYHVAADFLEKYAPAHAGPD